MNNLTGSVTIDNKDVPASDFEDDFSRATDRLLDDVGPLTLMRKINSLDELGLWLEIGDVDVDEDSHAAHVSLNLTDIDRSGESEGAALMR